MSPKANEAEKTWHGLRGMTMLIYIISCYRKDQFDCHQGATCVHVDGGLLSWLKQFYNRDLQTSVGSPTVKHRFQSELESWTFTSFLLRVSLGIVEHHPLFKHHRSSWDPHLDFSVALMDRQHTLMMSHGRHLLTYLLHSRRLAFVLGTQVCVLLIFKCWNFNSQGDSVKRQDLWKSDLVMSVMNGISAIWAHEPVKWGNGIMASSMMVPCRHNLCVAGHKNIL